MNLWAVTLREERKDLLTRTIIHAITHQFRILERSSNALVPIGQVRYLLLDMAEVILELYLPTGNTKILDDEEPATELYLANGNTITVLSDQT